MTGEHLANFATHGYVVLEGFLSPDELAASLEDLRRHFPDWEDFIAEPERHAHLRTRPDAGAEVQFPYHSDALTRDALHPRLLEVVGQLLGSDDIRLYQSHLWAKYAGTPGYEQQLHLDYRNHTLLVPDERHQQVEAIYYYTDVTAELGPTFAVSRQQSGDRPATPFVRSRAEDPDLYEAERAITCTAGSLLLYTPHTWHRGSAMTASAGLRFAHHVAFRRADDEWAGNTSWPGRAADDAMARAMATTSQRQQAALGVPPPGHPFWTPETLAAVASRYPAMDLQPYREPTGLATA